MHNAAINKKFAAIKMLIVKITTSSNRKLYDEPLNELITFFSIDS
jgi:hypothetical protein